jgi:hypothetical protein
MRVYWKLFRSVLNKVCAVDQSINTCKFCSQNTIFNSKSVNMHVYSKNGIKFWLVCGILFCYYFITSSELKNITPELQYLKQ